MQNKNNIKSILQEMQRLAEECLLMNNTALRLYENKEFDELNELCQDMVVVAERLAMLARQLPLYSGMPNAKEEVYLSRASLFFGVQFIDKSSKDTHLSSLCFCGSLICIKDTFFGKQTNQCNLYLFMTSFLLSVFFQNATVISG